MRRSIGAIRLSALSIACLIGLSVCEKSGTVHYRITVNVNGQKSARQFSRVWLVRISKPLLKLYTPFNEKFVGEAIPIELPGRPTLFALVGGSSPGHPPTGPLSILPEAIFRTELPAGIRPFTDRVESLRAISKMVGQTRQVSCEPPTEFLCPTFVYLDDINDPSTVHVVDPGNVPDMYKDVDLKKVYITIVRDWPSFTNFKVPAFENNARWSNWYSYLSENDPRKIRPEIFRRNY